MYLNFYILAIIASYVLSHMIANTVICGSDNRSAKRDIALQNDDFLERTWVKWTRLSFAPDLSLGRKSSTSMELNQVATCTKIYA